MSVWLVAPAVAHAHGALKSSVPRAGASLDTVPSELRFVFNERVELRLSKVVLLGPDGSPISIPPLRFGDATKALVVTGPLMELSAGRYEVRWQVAGADGHPTRGRFAFVIRAGAQRFPGVRATSRTNDSEGMSAIAAPAASRLPEQHGALANESANGFGERSLPYVVIRWLQYLVAFLMIGVVAFTRVVLPRALGYGDAPTVPAAMARDRSLRIGTFAAGALIVIQAARFLAQRQALRGSGDFRMDVSAADMLRGSAWGTGLSLILLGSIIALAVFRRMSVSGRDVRAPLMLGVALAAVGLGLSGHQAGSRIGAPVAVAVDAVHVLGTAGWLGTLAVLVLSGVPMVRSEDDDHAQVARILRAFSPVALVAASVAAASGLTLAALNLGSLPALWQSEYGRVLLLKLSVLALVAGTGAYNWRRVLPSLGTAQATRALRRSATAEVMVAMVVVAVTAVLVATPDAVMP